MDDYQAEEEDEISFKKGITLDVLQKSLDGWWVVKLDKVVGLAPATFLKKLECMESEVIEVWCATKAAAALAFFRSRHYRFKLMYVPVIMHAPTSPLLQCPSLRKVSPPMTATSPLRTFQQPPRK